MKTRSYLLLLALTLSLVTKAQEPHENRNFSPEQAATLMTKKMTLALDLDTKQQQAVFELFKTQVLERQKTKETYRAQRATGKKPSADDRYQWANKKLDKAIAHKKAMRKILDDKQFKKWEKRQTMRLKKGKKSADKKRKKRPHKKHW
jgi:hypothetical protein